MPTPALTDSTDRYHALDAVRGFALLLGIVFHATGSFLVAPEQAWLVTDRDSSVSLTLLFYVLHIFRMATFFLIAGFFARLLLQLRGERGFVRDRLRRIGLVLVAFWPLMLGLIVACLFWGIWLTNGGRMPPAPPSTPDPHAPMFAFPLTHLWFLYVLLWFYAAALLLRRLSGARRAAIGARLDRIVGRLLHNPVGLLLLALPTCIGLSLMPEWQLWFGVPTPDRSLLPNLGAISAFGSTFALGWCLHRQPALLRVLERRWLPHLLLALACTVACLGYIGLRVEVAYATPGLATTAYSAGYALALWSWSFALIGMALRFLSQPSVWRRYLADASYWLYLMHMPIVFALQVALSQLALPGEVKFILILAITMPVLLLSYRYCVRGTWIGAWLNGRRYLPSSTARRGSANESAAANTTIEVTRA